MAGNILVTTRSLAIRGLAMAAVLATFALGNLGAQVATALGVSSVALVTTTAPAQAQPEWGWRRGWHRGWGWRRGPGWRRGWRGDW